MKESMITTLVTVLSGVIVFVVCEHLKEIWLKPLQEYRQLKRRVSYLLTNYANYYCNPIGCQTTDVTKKEEYHKAAQEIREAACELRGFIEVLPRFHPGIPSPEKLFTATGDMIGLSNSFSSPGTEGYYDTILDNTRRRDIIRENLGFYENSNSRWTAYENEK